MAKQANKLVTITLNEKDLNLVLLALRSRAFAKFEAAIAEQGYPANKSTEYATESDALTELANNIQDASKK